MYNLQTLTYDLDRIDKEVLLSLNKPTDIFSLHITKISPDNYRLKILYFTETRLNTLKTEEAIDILLRDYDETRQKNYVQPRLETWLEVFRPLLLQIVRRIHTIYNRYTTEDLLSQLHLCVVRLYNAGYYLHRSLIEKAFLNDLRQSARRLSWDDVESLDDIINDDENRAISRVESLIDPDFFVQEERERDEILFEKVKTRMLEDISELEFNRILLQLKTKTVDRRTSYCLHKYRRIFNATR